MGWKKHIVRHAAQIRYFFRETYYSENSEVLELPGSSASIEAQISIELLCLLASTSLKLTNEVRLYMESLGDDLHPPYGRTVLSSIALIFVDSALISKTLYQ